MKPIFLIIINSIIATLLFIGVFLLNFMLFGKSVDPNIMSAIGSLVGVTLIMGIIFVTERHIFFRQNSEILLDKKILIVESVVFLIIISIILTQNMILIDSMYFIGFVIPMSICILFVNNKHFWILYGVHGLVGIVLTIYGLQS